MSLCDLTFHDSAILSVTASAGSVIGWLLRIVYVEERLRGAGTVSEPSCVRVIHEVREGIVGLAFGSPFVTGFCSGVLAVWVLAAWWRLCCPRPAVPASAPASSMRRRQISLRD